MAVLTLLVAAGCAHAPPLAQAVPQADGSYYDVQPGETLWRIAHDFGWDADGLARINRLSNPTQIKAGQRLFIPAPPESRRFLWPVRGEPSRSKETDGGSVRALEIRALEGSFVRASRTGRVAVAARDLTGFGKTVILDHGDGYVTIYARLEQMLVNPGATVRQGTPLGLLGRPPLYFEVRYGTQTHDPLRLLP